MAHSSQADHNGFENPLDELLGYQLRRASAAMISDLGRTLEDLDLNVTEGSILTLIESNPGITQSDIGRMLSIKSANMAPLTAALDKLGVIERIKDGRTQGLRLNAKGKSLAKTVRKRMATHEARFLAHRSKAERQALVALLREVWQMAKTE